MSKKILNVIKLQVKSGEANPAPPVGPALGQHGVNIMEFCKSFNNRTKDLKNIPKGTLTPVIINVYQDKSFSFIIKSPPASIMIKNLMGLDKGSSTPSTNKVGKITREQLEKIYEEKKKDLPSKDMLAGIKTIAGTAKSMGIEIEVEKI
jgi:large subunit ribosomal protein L11